jgi:hypothetical protein
LITIEENYLNLSPAEIAHNPGKIKIQTEVEKKQRLYQSRCADNAKGVSPEVEKAV